jgi:hypothetical protein
VFCIELTSKVQPRNSRVSHVVPTIAMIRGLLVGRGCVNKNKGFQYQPTMSELAQHKPS